MLLAKYLKDVAQATRENNHTYARKLVIRYVKEKHKRLSGVDKLEKCLDAITTLQSFYNYMPQELIAMRDDVEAATFCMLTDEEHAAFKEVL